VARCVWLDFIRARRSLFLFEVLFKLVEAWMLVPAIAVALGVILARSAHIAVSNQDIVDFLLTPFGLLYAALVGTLAVGLLLLEQAGIMVLAAERRPFKEMVRAALPKSWRVAMMGAVMTAVLALALLPFVLLTVVTHQLFLSQHDIYYYLQVRPPVF